MVYENDIERFEDTLTSAMLDLQQNGHLDSVQITTSEGSMAACLIGYRDE